MLTPQRLLRIVIELIFVLLGGLAAWLGLNGQLFFDRHSTAWLILSAALILWGLRALYRRGQWWSRWEHWTRGLSLVLLGLVMLAISRAPFGGTLAYRDTVRAETRHCPCRPRGPGACRGLSPF